MPGRGLRSSRSNRLGKTVRRKVAMLSRSDRELPSYFIVGAKRAGTTSLNDYILQHPSVLPALVEKGCRYFDVNFEKGWNWFVRNFPSTRVFDRIHERTGLRPIVGESSPYYAFHPEAPKRIADRFPEARLIFLLRDPVARTWSHYNYEVALGFEDLSIDRALDAEEARLEHNDAVMRAHAHRHFSYLARSRYAEQIEGLNRWFPDGQLLVLRSESLFSAPQDTMDRVIEHLGLPAFQGDFSRILKSNEYETIPDDVRERLADYFRGPNAKLSRLLGDEVTWP